MSICTGINFIFYEHREGFYPYFILIRKKMNDISEKIKQTAEDVFKGKDPGCLFIPQEGTLYSEESVLKLTKILGAIQKIDPVFHEYRGKKGNRAKKDIVTEADIKITNIMNDRIQELFPKDMVVSEEEKQQPMENPEGVVIFDPIDGTKNFFEGSNDCCTAFCRLKNDDGLLMPEFAFIWEPFNKVLSLGIKGIGVAVYGKEALKNDCIAANIIQFTEEEEKRKQLAPIIEKAFGEVKYPITGSESVEGRRFVCGETDVILKESSKLWDFFSSAVLCSLAGREVFFYDDNRDVFPASLNEIYRIIEKAEEKDQRKIKKVCMCQNPEQRERIIISAKTSKRV